MELSISILYAKSELNQLVTSHKVNLILKQQYIFLTFHINFLVFFFIS